MLGALSYPPIPIVEVGPLTLSLHGLFAGIGFVAGAWLMLREVKRRGFDGDKVISVLTWALIGAIFGARFFTVPAHIGDPGYGFGDAISIAGDYSILGGYAGGIIAGVIRGRMLGLSLWPHFDMAAPGMALGAVVGRIGDLAIVEHLGSPTTFFLGYQLRPGYDVSPQHDVLEQLCDASAICGPYHHTALYDLLGALVLLGFLLVLRRRWTMAHYGQLFAVWAIWYGLQRFFIDFARLGAARDGLTLPNGDVVQTIADGVMGPFTGSQWGALIVAAIGAAFFFWFRAKLPVVSAEQDIEYGAHASTDDDAAESTPDDQIDGEDADEAGDEGGSDAAADSAREPAGPDG
jgi:phosphatidylglycerol:prolipoprotein diacylglycerol transferase